MSEAFQCYRQKQEIGETGDSMIQYTISRS